MTFAGTEAGSGRVARKVAVVTGEGRGIGRATAQLLARPVARVAVAERDADMAQEFIDLIGPAGGEALAVVDDVADGDAVLKTFTSWTTSQVLLPHDEVCPPESIPPSAGRTSEAAQGPAPDIRSQESGSLAPHPGSIRKLR